MIEFVENYFLAADARGSITGILNTGDWREINLIRSEPGIVRGNHYHKRTVEGFLILQGNIEISVQRVQDGRLMGNKEKYRVSEGSIFIIEALVYHEFKIADSAVWMNFLSMTMDPACPDIHRIDFD